MPIVNYVREHIRFMEYATDEHLTASERLLWYALMHIMNQRAQGKVWPDEFVRISNDRLLSYCPMKYDTIASARNGLKQRGLIEFTPGEKNKKSPAYRMIYFSPEYAAPDTESDADIPRSIPKISDNTGYNMGGNIGGNMGYNMGGKPGGNTGDFNINYTDQRMVNPIQRDWEEDDQEQEEMCARMRAEAERAWRASFGKEATPAMLQALARCAVAAGFEPGVLTEAIRTAAVKGANSPMDYVLSVLADWQKQRVRSVADAQEYAFIFDAMAGKTPGGASVDDGIQAARAFRQDRETEIERQQRERREAAEEADREARAARIAENREARERQAYEDEKARLDRKYGVTA